MPPKPKPKQNQKLCDKCGINPASEEEQICPFASEINEDQKTCNCCDQCYRRCLEEV